MRTLAGVWATAGTVGGAGTGGVVRVGRAGRIAAEADIGEGTGGVGRAGRTAAEAGTNVVDDGVLLNTVATSDVPGIRTDEELAIANGRYTQLSQVYTYATQTATAKRLERSDPNANLSLFVTKPIPFAKLAMVTFLHYRQYGG